MPPAASSSTATRDGISESAPDDAKIGTRGSEGASPGRTTNWFASLRLSATTRRSDPRARSKTTVSATASAVSVRSVPRRSTSSPRRSAMAAW